VADLANVLKTFPTLSKWLDMSGPSKYDVKFSVGDSAAPEPSGPAPLPIDEDSDASSNRLVSLMSLLSTRLEQAVASRQFSLTGQVEFQGDMIRHLSMPGQRKENGRAIPRGEVRNMRGIARIEKEAFRIPDSDPATCDFSDSKNCALSGVLQFRQNDLPKMSVRISTNGQLRLDSWITGWGSELPKTPAPLVTGKTFELDADISARTIIYKGETAGSSHGELNYKLTQGETPRRTVFKRIEINGDKPGLGGLVGTGWIESYVWSPGEYPKWHAQVEVNRMPLNSLLNAVFKEPTTLLGLATGTIRLDGVGSDAQRIQGGGSAQLSNLVIGGTPVFQQVGAQTGRSFGGTLFETANSASFRVGNGALSSTDLKLQTRGLSMDLRGDYYFAGNAQQGIPEKTISGLLRLNVLQSVFGRIPILGPFAKPLDDVASTLLLAFQVSGNADHPNINPILLPLFSGALPQQ
jgi:hypothetical protein